MSIATTSSLTRRQRLLALAAILFTAVTIAAYILVIISAQGAVDGATTVLWRHLVNG